MKNYFITGATGFIGKILVEKLLRDNNKITALSKNIQKTSKNSYLNNIFVDISKKDIPDKFIKNIDTIIHLAGYAHDISGKKNDKFYKLLNIDATINIAMQAIKHNVKSFIFISSVKASDKNLHNYKRENFTYGASKKEAEIQLLKLFKNSNTQFSIIRPALVYGPNLKGNLGTMYKAIKRGWFPPLPKINNKKSLVHVQDVVSAIIFVENNKKTHLETYTVTDNRAYASYEIYEIFCNLLNKPISRLRVPMFFFKLFKYIFYPYKLRIEKLFNNEYSDCKKLTKLGFRNKFYLEDMNEKNF